MNLQPNILKVKNRDRKIIGLVLVVLSMSYLAACGTKIIVSGLDPKKSFHEDGRTYKSEEEYEHEKKGDSSRDLDDDSSPEPVAVNGAFLIGCRLDKKDATDADTIAVNCKHTSDSKIGDITGQVKFSFSEGDKSSYAAWTPVTPMSEVSSYTVAGSLNQWTFVFSRQQLTKERLLVEATFKDNYGMAALDLPSPPRASFFLQSFGPTLVDSDIRLRRTMASCSDAFLAQLRTATARPEQDVTFTVPPKVTARLVVTIEGLCGLNSSNPVLPRLALTVSPAGNILSDSTLPNRSPNQLLAWKDLGPGDYKLTLTPSRIPKGYQWAGYTDGFAYRKLSVTATEQVVPVNPEPTATVEPLP